MVITHKMILSIIISTLLLFFNITYVKKKLGPNSKGEIGNRGSKSDSLISVKEQRVDGSW